MGFFDTLRRVMLGDLASPDVLPTDYGLGEPWGVGEVGSGADDHTDRPTEGTSEFDRQQWERKLGRILDRLPDSRGQWDDLKLEAAALGFDPDWLAQRQRAEFALLVRRAVADRAVTEAEHRKLDLARELTGISESEAESILKGIVGEAESIFGKPVVDG